MKSGRLAVTWLRAPLNLFSANGVHVLCNYVCANLATSTTIGLPRDSSIPRTCDVLTGTNFGSNDDNIFLTILMICVYDE